MNIRIQYKGTNANDIGINLRIHSPTLPYAPVRYRRSVSSAWFCLTGIQGVYKANGELQDWATILIQGLCTCYRFKGQAASQRNTTYYYYCYSNYYSYSYCYYE